MSYGFMSVLGPAVGMESQGNGPSLGYLLCTHALGSPAGALLLVTL